MRARLIHVFALALCISGCNESRVPGGEAPPLSGGFIERADTTAVRERVTPAGIAGFPQRGKFTFPPPYNTTAVRVTNASDCVDGADCVIPVGYSYWSNMNNHVGRNFIYIFLGLRKTSDGDGKGPTLFMYNKKTDEVSKVGPLFDDGDPNDPTYPYRLLAYDTGEGWYFSATRPTTLYLNDRRRLLRHDVETRTFETVFDASVAFGLDKEIAQIHSSNDAIAGTADIVHSASLQCVAIGCTDGTHTSQVEYEVMGCLVYNETRGQFSYFPRTGEVPNLDECQIDQGGRWLVMMENLNEDANLDNRIIDLQTGLERQLFSRAGGVAHIDLGYGDMLGSDTFYFPDRRSNASVLYQFAQEPLQGVLKYYTWHDIAPAPNHISRRNARPDVPVELQYACGSGAYRENLTRSNEIICFLLNATDAVAQVPGVLVVAPVMTDLDKDGGSGGLVDDYPQFPKGNLDVTGQYFIWTDNMAGDDGTGRDRLDAFIVKVPHACLYRDPALDGPCDAPAGEAGG